MPGPSYELIFQNSMEQYFTSYPYSYDLIVDIPRLVLFKVLSTMVNFTIEFAFLLADCVFT